jgi:hypothetical protein
MTSRTAFFFFHLRDYFYGAASVFWMDSGAPEILPDFQEIWNSQNLYEALQEIAADLAREFPKQETHDDDGNYIEVEDRTDAVNAFVDAALAQVAWCDIARALTSEENGHE